MPEIKKNTDFYKFYLVYTLFYFIFEMYKYTGCATQKGRQILQIRCMIRPMPFKSNEEIYFIPSSEFNSYLKQMKLKLSTVKKNRMFSLVMITLFTFSL